MSQLDPQVDHDAITELRTTVERNVSEIGALRQKAHDHGNELTAVRLKADVISRQLSAMPVAEMAAIDSEVNHINSRVAEERIQDREKFEAVNERIGDLEEKVVEQGIAVRKDISDLAAILTPVADGFKRMSAIFATVVVGLLLSAITAVAVTVATTLRGGLP